MITWDPIAPGEVLLSQVNWGPRLGADSIATSTWSATTPPGLTVQSNTPQFQNGFTFIWISGATQQNVGTVYTITNTITTIGGQTEVETVQFICALK